MAEQNNPSVPDDLHLAQEHGLMRVDAWVRNAGEANNVPDVPRTGSAERMARWRAKKAAAGLVKIEVPTEIAAAVKAEGGWAAWHAKEARGRSRDEKSGCDHDPLALALGKRVMNLRGLRARLVGWALQ